jgi:hypothetical protein
VDVDRVHLARPRRCVKVTGGTDRYEAHDDQVVIIGRYPGGDGGVAQLVLPRFCALPDSLGSEHVRRQQALVRAMPGGDMNPRDAFRVLFGHTTDGVHDRTVVPAPPRPLQLAARPAADEVVGRRRQLAVRVHRQPDPGLPQGLQSPFEQDGGAQFVAT